jgi:hypothetical protein
LRRAVAAAAVFVVAAAAALTASHAAAALGPIAGSESAPPSPWRFEGLPQQKPPPTRFAVVERDGERVLRVEAERSYGTLLHPLDGVPAGALSWRWRVDEPIAGADLRTKQGDDAALKVCAFFDMPIERVPFVERQLLRVASSRLGKALPTATLCYVWNAALPADTLLRNAYTARVRFITAQAAPGAWRRERRDLAADFRRAFGDESDTVPPLTAVLIGADADNTGGRSLGFIAELKLETTPR